MREEALFSWRRWRLLALAGPVAMGAIMGTKHGLGAIGSCALAVPASLLGVALLMAPVLYIGLTLLGAAPPAREVVQALVNALAACGVVLLGLCPAVLFVASSVPLHDGALLLGTLALMVAVLIGVRALFAALLRPARLWLRALPVIAVWTPVALGLGLYFLVTSIEKLI